MAARVHLGDPSNMEATAAQRYWPRLFDHPGFLRGSEEDGRNHLHNYGYGILRAACARALRHRAPSVPGHQPSEPYNAFRLADGLMEPFQPLVDYQVARWCAKKSVANAGFWTRRQHPWCSRPCRQGRPSSARDVRFSTSSPGRRNRSLEFSLARMTAIS